MSFDIPTNAPNARNGRLWRPCTNVRNSSEANKSPCRSPSPNGRTRSPDLSPRNWTSSHFGPTNATNSVKVPLEAPHSHRSSLADDTPWANGKSSVMSTSGPQPETTNLNEKITMVRGVRRLNHGAFTSRACWTLSCGRFTFGSRFAVGESVGVARFRLRLG